MGRAFFVTGTDTDIGKTTVAAGLLHAARRRGLSTAAAKPLAAAPRQKKRLSHQPGRAGWPACRAACWRSSVLAMRGHRPGEGSMGSVRLVSGSRRASQRSTAARKAASCGRRALTS